MDVDPRSPERGQYQFVQAVIREVAYSTLDEARATGRHLAAAQYFETIGDEELASVLACHYLDAYRNAAAGAEADTLAAQARVGAAARPRSGDPASARSTRRCRTSSRPWR